MTNILKMATSSIKETFFVREELDQDRVKYFVQLYEVGATVPPLDIQKGTNVLLDGRHRLAALKFLNIADTLFRLIKIDGQKEAILYAFAANTKRSPKPPTNTDIDMVIRLLRKEGMSDKEIAVRISGVTPLPVKVIQRHVAEINSNDQKTAVRSAARAVANGSTTVVEAAKDFGVRAESVTHILNKWIDDNPQTSLSGIKGDLSAKFKSFASGLGAQARKLVVLHDAGDIDFFAVKTVYADMTARINHLVQAHEDRCKRLAAMYTPVAETVAVEPDVKKKLPKQKAPAVAEVQESAPSPVLDTVSSVAKETLRQMGL